MKIITCILTIILILIGCDSTKRIQRRSTSYKHRKTERQIMYTQPHQSYHDRPRMRRVRFVSGHRPYISYPTPK